MKQFIFTFLTISLSAMSFSQKNKTDWGKLNLQGKVKSVTEIEYKAEMVDGQIKKQYKGEWTRSVFNENGFLIEETEFEPFRGTIASRSVYRYDDSGKLVTIEEHGQDSSLASIYTFTYDSLGNQTVCNIEEVHESIKKQNARYVYSYDVRGNCIELKGFNRDYVYFTKYTYKYDSAGNRTEEIWFESNGDTIHTYTYSYDTHGKKTEEIYRSGSAEGYRSTTKYRYDEQGNIIEESWESVGKVTDKTTYTPDNNHNWVKSVTLEEGKVLSITEREIEYF